MSSSSPVPGLPFELVLAIIDAVSDVPTLSAISQTCRDLRDAALTPLYRKGLARDDTEVQSSANIFTDFDVNEPPRDYVLRPYARPIVLWAAAADPVYGLPVLERVLALRPLHLWATFHLPADTCGSHWPWATGGARPLSPGRTTALHAAAAAGSFLAVYWLLEDHRARSTLGLEVTATYACVCPSRHLQVVRQRHGVVDAEDSPDATPLHLALAHGHLEVAKLLILCGANWAEFTEGCHGVTGLMMIVANGHLALLEWLVGNGMLRRRHVEHEDNAGLTARDYLSVCGDEATAAIMAKRLSERRLDIPFERDPSWEGICGAEDGQSSGGCTTTTAYSTELSGSVGW